MQTAIHPETEKPRVFEALLLNAHWVPVMVVVFQFTLLGFTIGFKERRFRSPLHQPRAQAAQGTAKRDEGQY